MFALHQARHVIRIQIDQAAPQHIQDRFPDALVPILVAKPQQGLFHPDDSVRYRCRNFADRELLWLVKAS